MISGIFEAAASVENTFVKSWKSMGKPAVGYTCSYVPDEILHAAQILPIRLRGIEAEATTIGDTYFGPFICSFPKCLLQVVGEGKYNFLDGAIITPGCDSMRRLDECWRKCGDDHDGTLPDFFFHYGVPHKVTSYSIDWFVDETHRLIRALEVHFGVTITGEKLSEAIAVYNKGRTLQARLEQIRIRKDPVVSGADALAALLAGTTMPREIYNNLLSDYLDELENRARPMAPKLRLMFVGSVNDDVELLKVIEGDSAVVVSDNLCFGSRFTADLVDEQADPIVSLATRYLSHNECPRMFGGYKNRLAIVMDKCKQAKVDGVILQNIRFCDLHGSENGLFERDLEAAGIPCIRLEREYGPLVEKGRIKMRMDAFLERLAK